MHLCFPLARVLSEGAAGSGAETEGPGRADGTARPTTNNIVDGISAVSRITASGDACHKLCGMRFTHLQGTFSLPSAYSIAWRVLCTATIAGKAFRMTPMCALTAVPEL